MSFVSFLMIIAIKCMLNILQFTIMNLIVEKIFKNIDEFHLYIRKYKIQMCIRLKFQRRVRRRIKLFIFFLVQNHK